MLKVFNRFFILGALGLSSLLYSVDDSIKTLQLDTEQQDIEAIQLKTRRPGRIIFHGEVLAGRLEDEDVIPDGTPAEIIPFLIGPDGIRENLDPIPGVFIDHKLHTLAGQLHVPFTFDPVHLLYGTYHIGIAFKAATNQLIGGPRITVALRVIAEVERKNETIFFGANLRYESEQLLNLNVSPIQVVVPMGFTKQLLKNAD